MAKTYGTLSADGETSEHSSSYAGVNEDSGAVVRFLCSGSFGGGSLTLRYQCADGTYRDMTDGTFTANTDKSIYVSANSKLKAVLSGATTPSIYYEFSNMN